MADQQKECFDKLFQKFFPLKIVPVDQIPKKEEIISFKESEIDFYIKLAINMQILCSVKNGYGLSAVQCGLPIKLFVSNYGTSNFRTFIDCEYEGHGEKDDSLEGCLSLKTLDEKIKRFMVKRYNKISLSGYELYPNALHEKYSKINEDFSGVSSVVMQHEIDHHNGILINEIGTEVEVF
jgi:peptide deformylase